MFKSDSPSGEARIEPAFGGPSQASPFAFHRPSSQSQDHALEPKIIDHLAARQCSAQWKPFLQVMAQELSEHGSETELRVLALRMGSRFAARFDLGACQTVQEMQTAMNQVWREIDWGWVTLEETPVHLAIHHRCSPLTAAFDGASPSWISGFLEGVYQRWFETLGASALQVQQVSSPDEFGSIEFRLGQ